MLSVIYLDFIKQYCELRDGIARSRLAIVPACVSILTWQYRAAVEIWFFGMTLFDKITASQQLLEVVYFLLSQYHEPVFSNCQDRALKFQSPNLRSGFEIYLAFAKANLL